VSRVLVVLHAASEPLGMLAEPLTEGGLALETRLMPAALPDSLGAYDGLVIMGGSQGAYEAGRFPFLRAETALMREALAQGIPALGVCLGSQILAAAGGARVYPGAGPEVGWLPVELVGEDPWLAGWPARFEPLHWHGDTFDLPPGATLLASSAVYAHQAFRLGSALGLQFHVEATEAMARSWMEDETLGPDWRPKAVQLARCREAAAAMAPLAASLGRALAGATRARTASRS
jgi:GMP synthase (glutamine-hydrolysing)